MQGIKAVVNASKASRYVVDICGDFEETPRTLRLLKPERMAEILNIAKMTKIVEMLQMLEVVKMA